MKHFEVITDAPAKKRYILDKKHSDLLPDEIQSISAMINKYIERSGLSGRKAIKKLSDETGISESTLWDIKLLTPHPVKGTLPNPTYENVRKIVDATGYEGRYFPKDVS